MADMENKGTEPATKKPEGKTVKYRCTTKCYWTGILYREGDTVDVEPGVKVPEHFTKID